MVDEICQVPGVMCVKCVKWVNSVKFHVSILTIWSSVKSVKFVNCFKWKFRRAKLICQASIVKFQILSVKSKVSGVKNKVLQVERVSKKRVSFKYIRFQVKEVSSVNSQSRNSNVKCKA